MRVLAAMSGGVDSAVAAARAADAGHEVVGVHLALNRMPGTLRTGSRGCCTIEDSRDAARVAGMIGIPFYVWDFSERFKEDVVDDFIAEYSQGRTPNPCMRCNERIKFAALLDRALALGFDAVATGHYAEVVRTPAGSPELHRGHDMNKDQSYVLGVLTGPQLEHCLFPIGASAAKAEVRAEAAERGFPVASKPDSYDICFVPDGDTKAWLADKIPMRPGLIRDEDGAVLGEHEGAMSFTVGQRRGLSLERPAVDGRPRYVTGVDARSNTVTVGGRAALFVDALTGIRTSWCGEPPADLGRGEGAAIECEVQIRAHSEPVPARAWLGACESEPPASEFDVPAVRPAGQLLHVRTAEPLTGVAPGQTMVLYRGTRVLGQATIDRTARWEEGGAAPAQQPEPAGAGAALD
ncbi:tRNA 2-thiouridine(34) synthase MnmA [Brevibacterium sp. 5221]|uniref:tRNA-specific 2-thiouridylase MnmA n=1 Tax=Brevibacterium rongguiense TaxID=2695267 RepID=A0A6N9H829_9MICO|nr:tRNA 2-thiouridine(34) synthase MnmA [Brevibacterium rongguiense]MYM20208.1 tRNA 2-thiouridine(34) synthase MnmA [Brevibacterium rongguiense]